MKNPFTLYTVDRGFAFSLPIFFAAVLTALGCGGAMTASERVARSEELLAKINQVRQKEGLEPLAMDQNLTGTAQARADHAASSGKIEQDSNSLPRLTAAGSFARFALSHELKADSAKEVIRLITQDPISRSKIIHPNINGFGVGFAKGATGMFAAMDLARLVPPIDAEYVRKELSAMVDLKRLGNSVAGLKENQSLKEAAMAVAEKFMRGEGSSDDLIAKAQSELNAETFALGRVMITFQVAAEVTDVVIPERTSDPGLAYIGIGFAQGNHPDHEPGSMAVVLFLAEPQTAHDASRDLSNLPPPKSAPSSKTSSGRPLEDQAWVATLAGNHKKAARLFKRAYQKTKKPGMLYEAARAHARDEDLKSALKEMKAYAEMAEGEDRDKAQEMVALLEKGESIFSVSVKEQMSVEAKRFFVMGQSLFNQKEWIGAVDAFQQAYAFSKHPDIVYNIGLTHLRAGRMGEALDYFGEYQRLVPEATSAEEAQQFFNIGVELYRAGQFEAASGHFAMAYGFHPFPELIYNMALCHKALGDTEMSLRFFREFLDTDPPRKDRAEAEEMMRQMNPDTPRDDSKEKEEAPAAPKEKK